MVVIAWLSGSAVLFWAVMAILGWMLAIVGIVMFLKVGEEADEAYRELRIRDLDEARARFRHPSGSSVRRIPIQEEETS